MRLTDLQIRKLKSPDRGQKTYYDGALPGFGVRVSQGGSKSFVVMYGKKRQLKTIGRYPDTGLADARREAKRIQSDVTLLQPDASGGVKPMNFNKARDRFIRDSEIRTKPKTVEEYRRLLTRHFQFEKNVSDITRSDIMNIIGKQKNAPSEAQHAFVAIRTMMNWCTRHGLLETSPVPAMKFKTASRSRILSDNELQAVWHRAEEFGYPYGRIVQLLLLTGQRRGEIAGLRWDWIKDDTIVVPQGFAKNKREHHIPIGPLTMQIIEKTPRLSSLLFPSRFSDEKTFSGWSKSKRNFDEPIDVPAYTLHDLRRTYSSNMARLGVPIHVTERLLNHTSGTVSGIAAVYNRYTYSDEMRDAVDLHEDFVVTQCH